MVDKKRKKFSQTAILQRLVDVKPRCKICKRTARQTQLDLHHRDRNSGNTNWRNIVIYCRACHNDVEKTRSKKRHL